MEASKMKLLILMLFTLSLNAEILVIRSYTQKTPQPKQPKKVKSLIKEQTKEVKQEKETKENEK